MEDPVSYNGFVMEQTSNNPVFFNYSFNQNLRYHLIYIETHNEVKIFSDTIHIVKKNNFSLLLTQDCIFVIRDKSSPINFLIELRKTGIEKGKVNPTYYEYISNEVIKVLYKVERTDEKLQVRIFQYKIEPPESSALNYVPGKYLFYYCRFRLLLLINIF